MLEANTQTLSVLEDLSRQAGAAILADKARSSSVTLKEDASPLTSADLASHRTIVEGLGRSFPGVPVLSEESARISFEKRAAWEQYFLVDPLDGTKEFIKGRKEYTVNVALIQMGQPILGVVFVPELETTFSGAAEEGAFIQKGQQPRRRIAVAPACREPLRVVGSSSHASPEMSAFLELVGKHEILQFGSSLKLCQVADATADFYPRFGPTSEWDTAAGHAVVRAAGGRVVTLSGSELTYNQKESLLNPAFFVLGPTDRDLLSLCREVASPNSTPPA